MRRKIASFLLGGTLAIAAVAPAAAAPPENASLTNALIGLTVQAVVRNVDVLNNSANDLIDVNINDSLNNLLQNALQNADINVVRDSLNNVLNDLSITVQDIHIADDGIVVTVLGGGGIADLIVIG